MSSMKIITPKGAVREVDKVVPVVETRFAFNGQDRRFVETAKSMAEKPTALALHYADNSMGGLGCSAGMELFVGNLSSQQVIDIQQALAKEGFFDFGSLEYQEAQHIHKTVFDKGASKPYTSDVTCIFSSFTGTLLGAGFNNMGCVTDTFGSCGNGIFSGNGIDEDFCGDTSEDFDGGDEEGEF